MTSTQISTFLLVCEYLNFTEAASRLYITPSAVSRQISNLEEELDAKLFLRNNNTVHLTIAGEELYRGLQKIYPVCRDLFHTVSDISKGLIGKFRIGILSDQTLDEQMQAYLSSFKECNPHVQISFKRFDFRALQENLLTGTVDLGISLIQGKTSIPRICSYCYREENVCLAVPTKWVTEKNLSPSFSELKKRAKDLQILQPGLNTFDEAVRLDLMDMESDNPFAKEDISFTDDFDSIPFLVSGGMHSCITNESCILSDMPSVTIFPLTALPPIQKGIFWTEQSHSQILHDFLKHLENFGLFLC